MQVYTCINNSFEIYSLACPGGVLWVLKHPARTDPEKKKEKEKKRKRRKEKEKEEERKKSNDNEKYFSPLSPLNGFQISRHGPIRRTPQQF